MRAYFSSSRMPAIVLQMTNSQTSGNPNGIQRHSRSVSSCTPVSRPCPPSGLTYYLTESWVIRQGNFAASVAFTRPPSLVKRHRQRFDPDRPGSCPFFDFRLNQAKESHPHRGRGVRPCAPRVRGRIGPWGRTGCRYMPLPARSRA